MSLEDVIQSIKASILKVQSNAGNGTGFVVSNQGHILTCAHVLVGDLRRWTRFRIWDCFAAYFRICIPNAYPYKQGATV
jgi:hypothetical protein